MSDVFIFLLSKNNLLEDYTMALYDKCKTIKGRLSRDLIRQINYYKLFIGENSTHLIFQIGHTFITYSVINYLLWKILLI